MGAALSTGRSLTVTQRQDSLARLQERAHALLHLWARFWIFATGLERHEELVWRVVQQLKHRVSRSAAEKRAFAHRLVMTLVELWLRTLRVVLVPDVFARYLCATFALHIVYELQSVARHALGNTCLRLTAKGRRALRLRQQLENVKTFQERQSIAGELDKLEGKDKWREDPASALFQYERVMNKTQVYKRLKLENDVVGLMFSLRAGLLRKHWGLGHPRLYSVSNVGTKRVIDEYLDAIVQSMNVVLRAKGTDEENSDELSIDNKLAFFSETRHAFGRSALMLSGGGAHGFYHAGVIKALVENNLLPSVIAGSSAGSILAGAIGVRHDDEVLEYLAGDSVKLNFLEANISEQDRAHYTPSFLPPAQVLLPKGGFELVRDAFVLLSRFLDKRYVLDTKTLRDCLRSVMGDYTFREAYDRTGRIINVTVTPLSAEDYPQLLNYLTAPNVIIWSASLASCAIPNLFRPVELLAKDENGNIVPYYREGLKWSDGSVECDLPMERLSELFNVNHFIVSQVNIHYKIVSGHAAFGNGQTGSLMSFLKKQMKAYIKNIAEFGLNTSVLKFLDIGFIPLITQKYEGDITICPTDEVPAAKLLRTVLSNPTLETFPEILLAGERACWPALARIRTMCRVEFALERAVRYLRGEQALEDERRSGRKAIGRVPSFYTSPSSMNLSNLDHSPPTPRGYASPPASEGKRSRHGSIEEGEMIDAMGSPTANPMRRNRSMNIAGAVISMDGGANASDFTHFDL
ncbi:mitogen-activated protein kinase tyrosine protein phosphatase sdp1 [Phytophthora pseudosyringae]|uniref:Mitogen-activated protein kinase tyrosine protein phosphatase sdp1 n=1 Tax=Phytophthora pseudosyringae TaxID=221518 RepID=A0A8T1W9S4_9STRA|nr:mitogen-activated protein kinase tyrosine protein phosphatase sdp1 [Phytophthora pseudosyringae]